MRRLKYGILLLLFIGLGLVLYKFYPLVEAKYYNSQISASGVKLLMTEEELNKTLAKGEFVPGMGGNGWRFSESQVFVMTSSIGLFRNKVSYIETENPSHSILGLKAGDNYETASASLENYGFKQSPGGCFSKGNVQVQLSGGSMVSRIRITIQDPAYKDVVF